MTAARFLSDLRYRKDVYAAKYKRIQEKREQLYSLQSPVLQYGVRVMGGTHKDTADVLSEIVAAEEKLYRDIAEDALRYREAVSTLDALVDEGVIDALDLEMIFYKYSDGKTVNNFYRKVGLSYDHARVRLMEAVRSIQAYLDEKDSMPVKK